jgi:superfamily II DNA or RNA helicase
MHYLSTTAVHYMRLRDYQIKAVHDIYANWANGHKNVMLQLATGGGKTVIMSHILANHHGYSVAIAHRLELVSQISLTLARFGIQHNIIAQKATIREIISTHLLEFKKSWYDPLALCQVAAVDTLIRLPEHSAWFKQVTLVVQDEGHHVLKKNKWGKAASLFPNARGIYPTATVCRSDGKGLGRHSDGLADALVCGVTMRDLILQGSLCDYRIFAPPSDLDLSNVTITAGGDYSAPKLRTAVHKSKITGDVVEHYLKIAPGKLGVTFAVDIQAATDIALEFKKHGVPAEVISSKTPDLLRYTLMHKFKNREILQLVNVDILGEGVDVPAIEVISMARPTQSYTVFAQQFGRSLRPLPGKEHALIIDHVNNCMRHGLPDAPRNWSLDARERKARNAPDDVVPLKTCLKCYAVYTRRYKSCPHCGHYSPPTFRGLPEFVDGDLTELDEKTLSRLRGEIARIDGQAHPPAHLAPYIQQAIITKHQARSDAQHNLRANIAMWAGYLKHSGNEDSEIYRQFYFNFNTDVLTAQTLNVADAIVLSDRILYAIEDLKPI